MEVTPTLLRQVAAISEVPVEQLQWLIDKGSLLEIPAGGRVFSKGDPIERLFVVLKGGFAIKVERNGHFKPLAEVKTFEVSGALPYSRATNSIGYAEAIEDTVLLILPKANFKELTARHFELTEALVHIMTSRTREFAKRNLQEEKMMALGKLSAGLAHELNNPASAMARSAEELKKHLGHVPEKFKRVIAIRAEPEEIDVINDTLFNKLKNTAPENMGLMERTEKEDELESWLEDQGVENAYEFTQTFVDFDMDVQAMEKIRQVTNTNNFPPAVEWIANVLTTEKMVGEIQEAAERISALVSSVKRYTHMDSAPERVPTDIKIGILSTLTMLNHKLKAKGITVKKEFREDLPKPKIMVSEMNQVWTNLIDNAIDAMATNGNLTIKTYLEGEFVKIAVQDDGKGIPEAQLSSIFDPFFTTKAIGEGTGMGLEVVQRIVHQHNGDIKVRSRLSETVFTVCLPVA